jgi:type I restriction enzyme S subunit
MSTDKNKLIPELRFPEFADEREWKKNPLKELCEVITKGTTPTTLGFRYIDKGVNFIKIESIEDGDINLSKVAFISNECNESLKRSKLKENDILFSIAGALGVVAPICKKQLPANTNQALSIIRLKKEYNKDYIIKFLLSPEITSEIHKLKAGAAQLNISLNQVGNFRILLPQNPQEQQKIASCLSSLDEVIAAQSQKLATLKDHKKGLMQNLFPTNSITNDELEITNVPNYRFPEFLEDGDWEEKKLEEVAIFLKGKGISKADIVENGNLACIRYGELYTHYQETISEIKSYTNLDAANLVLSKANDIIIPASGETQIDIATASCVLEKGIALGGDLNIIRTKINGVFLSYYLNNAKKMEIAQMAQGISVVHLYPSQLKTLVISIPKPEEQQKIAFCLSSLDELITAQTEKIAQLKLHKKGLMQGLFPKLITN